MSATHTYELTVRWTGNFGQGTSSYRSYGRDNEVHADGKAIIVGSADTAFRGDARRWSPEELLVASLSQCHMLWYLHLASSAGIVVTAYADTPVGTMSENDDGTGQFDNVLLRPAVTVTDATMCESAIAVHDQAEKMCFIARSVNFPVRHEPTASVADGPVPAAR
jgi:organic hydroperoxide reductase OsmC/OhrA